MNESSEQTESRAPGEHRPRVVYLHGFNSSPASLKARRFVEFCTVRHIEYAVPVLSHDPDVAMNTALACITQQASMPALLIGSSLGGYYATWFTEHYGIPSALVNPAVSPCDQLHDEFLGMQRNHYTGEEYEFTAAHVDALRRYDSPRIRDPRKYLLLVQTGDEVLDYRLAVQRYEGCEQDVQPGGNHSYENFADKLPCIMRFAGLQ
jgi:uncharacterized protein